MVMRLAVMFEVSAGQMFGGFVAVMMFDGTRICRRYEGQRQRRDDE